jgi:hypothetical protein
MACIRLIEIREHHSWCFMIDLLNKSERTFVGLIVKLIRKSQLLAEDFVFVLRNLITSL